MSRKLQNQPVLVAVDFSEHSVSALLKACELTACTDQALIVLHVVHDPAEMPGYYGKLTKQKKLLRIEDLAQEAFDAFMLQTQNAHPKVKELGKAKQLLVIGIPATRILEVAEKINAAMVVMGSQGRTGLSRVLLGSKAEQVVRLCPRPVLIVKRSITGPDKGKK